MIPNVKPSKMFVATYASGIPAQSVAAAGNVTGGWISCANIKWAKILSLCGAGAGTLAVKLEQAKDGSGTSAKDLATAATLALTVQANATVYQVDFDVANNLDLVNGFGYIRLNATVTGGSGQLIGVSLELGPQAYEA